MEKTLRINAGSTMLLNEKSEILSGYDSININSGNTIISRKVYEKLIGMGVAINCGNMKILDITGRLVELDGNITITVSTSLDGCYVVCDGNLIVEDVKGLDGITGLYAKHLFLAESVDLGAIHNIDTRARTVYPDNAELYIGNIVIDETTPATLTENTLYWVHGNIKALSVDALNELRSKGVTFHCTKLIIYNGMYKQNSSMISADSYVFIPDDHNVVGDITLDSATVPLYGEKIYVLGDLMIPYNQTQYLNDFLSLIVRGTVTMPLSAASMFKVIGKADDFELYDGVLMSINGFQTIGHEQCQTAIERGITYTIKVNGSLYFMNDVTAQDMDAISAVYCNGIISAPDKVRGILDSKVKEINGKIIDIDAMLKKQHGDDYTLDNNPIEVIEKAIKQITGDGDGNTINSGSFKL